MPSFGFTSTARACSSRRPSALSPRRLHPAAETREYIVALEVDVGGVQQTKTKTALEYFSAELVKARNASRFAN